MKPLRVANKQTAYLYLLLMVGFMIILLVSNRRPDEFICLQIIFYILLFASWFWSFNSFVQMSDELVQLDTRSGSFMMKWDEVQRIELSPTANHHITFYGSETNDRESVLSISGFNSYQGKEKAAMIELFNRQIEKHRIPVEKTPYRLFGRPENRGVAQDIPRVDYPFSFNCKIGLVVMFLILLVATYFLISEFPRLELFSKFCALCGIAIMGRRSPDTYIEMNDTAIRLFYFSAYEIRWDEVERVEMPAANSREMVFYGKDKVLAIAGPDWWFGFNNLQMNEHFNRQIELRNIPIVRKLKYKRPRNKNTKLTNDIFNVFN
jgi:hypothetical protein